MRTRHVNGLLIAAILVISTAPLYAQRQQQNVAKLKADARNLVGIIGSDKTKTQTRIERRCRNSQNRNDQQTVQMRSHEQTLLR